MHGETNVELLLLDGNRCKFEGTFIIKMDILGLFNSENLSKESVTFDEIFQCFQSRGALACGAWCHQENNVFLCVFFSSNKSCIQIPIS